MRRLKLQMQVSADGMIATRTQTDRGHFNWDTELRQYSIDNAANVDSILLGRKTATGFIPYWESVAANPKDDDFEFGKLVTDTPKVVFSRTLQKSEWPNATVLNGEIAASVNQLKRQTGKDGLVYGGSGFVTSLIEHNLIDEYHLLVASESGRARKRSNDLWGIGRHPVSHSGDKPDIFLRNSVALLRTTSLLAIH
jgi:dihydrofolate reductase